MELLSPFHLIIILAVVVLLFGGRKIPEVMKGMGEGIRSFKDGMRGEPGAPAAGQTTPTVTLSVAPNPLVVGQPTVLTAIISPAPTGASMGSVSFFNGSTSLGTANVAAGGVATQVATGLPAGTLNLTAAYSGNASFSGAAAAVAVTVNSPAAVAS